MAIKYRGGKYPTEKYSRKKNLTSNRPYISFSTKKHYQLGLFCMQLLVD